MIEWNEEKLFLGTTEEDNSYLSYLAEKEPFRLQIVPTYVIHGNPGYRKDTGNYTYLINHKGCVIGWSSTYSTLEACKQAAEDWLNTAYAMDIYQKEGWTEPNY